MKANIHPTWFNDAKVTCACGNTFTTGSTHETIKLEICSKCHPLYTGQQRYVDTLGQVERFNKKQEETAAKREVRQKIIVARAEKAKASKEDRSSLKDMLMQARKQLHS